MTSSLFNQFALLLALTCVVGFVAVKLRQPLILAFIIVGVIAGPYCLNLIAEHNETDILASFGITLLLFIVGLKLDIHAIKAFGSVVLKVGLMQMLLTTLLGFCLAYALGIKLVPALVTAMAMAFSSTIIIIKALSDREEIDSLFGRISIGILIVQDITVVIAIIILSSLNFEAQSADYLIQEIAMLILRGIGFLAVVAILMRSILPSVMDLAGKSRELVILFALAWAVILAATAEALGFGKEIGGFLAGVSLASTRYRESIASRLDTLRNLLLVFFFINLGAALRFDALSDDMLAAVMLSIFVLFIKPLIVMMLMGYARFRKRTSFMTAVTMGQVSEFSLILVSLAYSLGYVSVDTVGLVTFMSLITIGLSTYMMNNASELYNYFSPVLNRFEHKFHNREDVHHSQLDHKIDVIIYGCGRQGGYLAAILEKNGLKTLGIDFDPRRVQARNHQTMPVLYGDAEDAEFVKTLPLHTAQWVVSTIPHYDSNQMLVSALREAAYGGKIAISAFHENEIESVKKLSVDLVFIPYRDAAISAAEQIVSSLR